MAEDVITPIVGTVVTLAGAGIALGMLGNMARQVSQQPERREYHEHRHEHNSHSHNKKKKYTRREETEERPRYTSYPNMYRPLRW